jgi:O-acetyl-ADP-ribose deacetylase (regulator of RNase III)
MSFEIKIGDLFSVTEGYIVHGCNSHGVMGSGVAAIVRKKYPGAHNAYLERYRQEGLIVGSIVPHWETEKLCIVNAVTQKNMGHDKDVVYASYPGILASFIQIADLYHDKPMPVHFPLIGCGLANGNWNVVKDLILQGLGHDIPKTLWILHKEYESFHKRYLSDAAVA